MHARRLLLVPTFGVMFAVGSHVDRARSRATDPLTTLKTVTGSDLFQGPELIADSGEADDGWRAYRPKKGSPMRRRITMRVRSSADGTGPDAAAAAAQTLTRRPRIRSAATRHIPRSPPYSRG